MTEPGGIDDQTDEQADVRTTEQTSHPTTALPVRTRQLLEAAAAAADDKLASDVVAFDVADRLPLTDAFLIASASNDRQVNAIVEAVEERLATMGAKPVAREGAQEGRWVLLDYADIVVHVQHEEERRFYALERLWRDCPQIALDAVRDSRRHDDATAQDGPA